MSGKPKYKVFTVEERAGETNESEANGYWTRLGSAWEHKDRKGLNIVLQALPINGRLVLREFDEKDAEEEQKNSKSRGQHRR